MDRAGLKLYLLDQFTLLIGLTSSQNTRSTWLCYKGITSDINHPYQTLAKNFFVLFNYFTHNNKTQFLTCPWCRDQISTETVEIECWVQTYLIRTLIYKVYQSLVPQHLRQRQLLLLRLRLSYLTNGNTEKYFLYKYQMLTSFTRSFHLV